MKIQQLEFEEVKKTEFANVISNFDRLSDPNPVRNDNIGHIINEARNGPAEQILGNGKKQ